MISNYVKLKILLTGDQFKDSFWRDIRGYRAAMHIPPQGFDDERQYKAWLFSEQNGDWSEEAAKELLRSRPGTVFENLPKITAILIPKIDFRDFNQAAYEIAARYRLDSTGSVYKKITDVLLYNDTSLKPKDVDQPVDIFSGGQWNSLKSEMYFVFNKHTRVENFIAYTKRHRQMISLFQKYLPIQKKSSFVATLNPDRQSVEIRIFKNTKPSAIKKSWREIKLLQKQLEEYSEQTKDPYEPVLLAVDQVKSKLFTQRDGGGLRRLTVGEKLKEVERLSKIIIGESQYKDYKKLINKIRKGR